jgi:hypothetical protein
MQRQFTGVVRASPSHCIGKQMTPWYEFEGVGAGEIEDEFSVLIHYVDRFG